MDINQFCKQTLQKIIKDIGLQLILIIFAAENQQKNFYYL